MRSRRAFLKHRHQGRASADAENSDCVSAVCFLFKPHIFVGEEVEFSCDSGRCLFCIANVFAEMPQNPSPKYPKCLHLQIKKPTVPRFLRNGRNFYICVCESSEITARRFPVRFPQRSQPFRSPFRAREFLPWRQPFRSLRSRFPQQRRQ